MRDGFKNYDKWKLASPDDADDEREIERQRREDLQDRADEKRDRQKDDEAQRWAEIENAMLHGGG
jgi:hypothetical protein